MAQWPGWPGYDISGYTQSQIDAISVESLFNLGLILNIDSISQSVSQSAEFHLAWIADDITGYSSAPTAFNLGSDGIVNVTLDYFQTNVQLAPGVLSATAFFPVTATFDWTPSGNQPSPSIPEPGTLALMGIALTSLALRKRSRMHT